MQCKAAFFLSREGMDGGAWRRSQGGDAIRGA
jgi:hypothetical protein